MSASVSVPSLFFISLPSPSSILISPTLHPNPPCGVDVPKAVTFFPFLINWTLTHFRIAELGCLASTPTFSRTIPLAWDEPPNGEDLKAVPSALFLYERSAHRCSRRWFWSFLAALRPRGFPVKFVNHNVQYEHIAQDLWLWASVVVERTFSHDCYKIDSSVSFWDIYSLTKCLRLRE